jgi:hypothetical protein
VPNNDPGDRVRDAVAPHDGRTMELTTATYLQSTGWSARLPTAADGPRTLVLAFGAAALADDPRPLAELAAAFPQSHLIGCSTSGHILGDRVADDGLVAAVARFERSDLATAVATVATPADSAAAGRQLAAALSARPGLRAVFVCSDGLAVNGSELAHAIGDGVGPSVLVTGGLAGDGDRFRRTWVAHGATVGRGTVAAVGLYGEHLRVGHGSAGGWDRFGPERRVTRSAGNVLFEIDGRPALALYKQYLGDRAAGLPATALLFPLALRSGPDQAHHLVRTVLAVDEAAQSMTFAGDVPQGHLAQLMRANPDRLIDGAAAAAGDAAGHGDPADAAGSVLTVAVSCVGRRLVLGERTEEELEAVAARVGFYSYGEICPHSTDGHPGAAELHNQTMTVTRLAEAA